MGLVSAVGLGLVLTLGLAPPVPARAESLAQANGNGTAAAGPDRLGVWLTTVDSTVLSDPVEADRALLLLRRHGFTRAAVPLLTGGRLTWPAAAERNRLNLPVDAQISGGSVGPLLQQLRRGGLRTVGWFEFGLMAPAGAPWLRGRDDLLLLDASGSPIWTESPGLDRVWLNPSLVEVQTYLIDLVVDACRRLPLDVIQFDDHLGYPSRFGYDPLSLGLWRQTAEGAANPTPEPQDGRWLAWRAATVTALLQRIRGAMAQQCPTVKLSISPNPQDFSYQNYLADWSDWVARGLVDEVVIQIYRTDLKALQSELAQPSVALARSKLPVRIGLLAGLKGRPKDAALLRSERALVAASGLEGVDLFFYESVRPHFP